MGIALLMIMIMKMSTIRVILSLNGYPLMKRMLITVPEGIQPSEVGHHGSVESNCVRDQPFNEDFDNQFLKKQ